MSVQDLAVWKGSQARDQLEATQAESTSILMLESLLPLLLDIPGRSHKIEDVMQAVSSEAERLLLPVVGARCSVFVDLFVIDVEGLWTAKQCHGRGMFTIGLGKKARGMMASVASDGVKRVVVDAYKDRAVAPEEDLLGIDLQSRSKDLNSLSLLCLPVTTIGDGGEARVRGVLRYAIQNSGDESFTRLEESVLCALAKVLGGAIAVLDAAAASKVRESILSNHSFLAVVHHR